MENKLIFVRLVRNVFSAVAGNSEMRKTKLIIKVTYTKNIYTR
jgi:hypothetical protein